MPRKNRYSGVLQPLQVGQGRPSVALLLIYDIEDDRLRARVADVCLDYGLERIQYSAFFGRLDRNRRQELALRVQAEIGAESARVRIFPLCDADLKDAWKLEQYQVDADELARRAGERMPSVRVIGGDED